MSNIYFYNTPKAWFVIGYLLITALLIYWEYKKDKSWLGYLATAVLTFSLLMIYLRPSLEVNRPIQSIVLIGDGVNQLLLDSLITQKKYPVFVQEMDTLNGLNSFILHGSKNNIPLNAWEKQADTIYTIGHIPHMPSNYTRRELLNIPPSFDIAYSREIKLGDTLKVALTNRTEKAMDVVISVEGEKPIQENVLAGETFTAQYKKKVSGNFHSSLVINETSNYQLNTKVEESEALLIMLLAESPDFEWKFLNNFLANKGHAVLWRTKVSKEIFKEQVTNWPDSMESDNMKASYSNYDLIISDVQAWNGLSYGKQNEIIEAARAAKLSYLFRSNAGTTLNDKTNQLSVGIRGGDLVESEVLQWVENGRTRGWQQLNEYQYKGVARNARLALLSLQNSFIWVLNGEKEKYERFWNDFINTILVKEQQEFIFSDAFAFKAHPFMINKWDRNAINELTIIDPQADTLKLKAKDHNLMEERKAYEFFPATEGWYQILLADGSSHPFYVHPSALIKESLGQAFYQYNYHNALESNRYQPVKNSQLKSRVDITFWFFGLLLVCLSYLWVEEKFSR